MAPINFKQSSSPATAQTIAASSQDARLLVRETLRISANLASSPANATPPVETTSDPSSVSLVESECRRRIGSVAVGGEEFIDSSLRLICCEEIDGRRWKFVAENDGSGGFKKNSFRALSLHSPQAPLDVSLFFYSQLNFVNYTLYINVQCSYCLVSGFFFYLIFVVNFS